MCIGQTFDQEPIMATVALRIIAREPENSQDRQFQGVTQLDRVIQGQVVDPSLGALHPVENASTFRVGIALDEDSDPGVGLEEGREVSHEGEIPWLGRAESRADRRTASASTLWTRSQFEAGRAGPSRSARMRCSVPM